MDAIKASWSGKERLWKVFWIYNWLFGAALNALWKAIGAQLSPGASAILGIPVLAWGVWATVSLWRCAFNADWRGWGYIARAVVVLGLIALCLSIYAIVFLGIEPRG